MSADTDETIRASLDTVLDVFCDRHPRGFIALTELSRPDFWFRDPLVEIHGFKSYKAFLRESSAHRVETRWTVLGAAVSQLSGYVRWHYAATYKDGASLAFDGMTEFGFDGDGRLAFQIDFWDAAEVLAVIEPKLRDQLAVTKKTVHL